MEFDVIYLKKESKKRETLQPKQLEYVEDILGCFFESAKVKKAVGDIQFFEKMGCDAKERMEVDKWYAVEKCKIPFSKGVFQTMLTIGLKDRGNHVVGVADVNENIESGKTFIGVNPEIKVESIVDNYIEKHRHSWGATQDYEGCALKEYILETLDLNTLLKYGVYCQGFIPSKYFIYNHPRDKEVRYMTSTMEGNEIVDTRFVKENIKENDKYRTIVEENNGIEKLDEFGVLKYSVKKKGNNLELNILIPPEEEMGNYIKNKKKNGIQ